MRECKPTIGTVLSIDGKVYNSFKEASENEGLCKVCLARKARLTKEDEFEYKGKHIKILKKSFHTKPTRIMCVETNTVYDSVYDASDQLYVSEYYLRQHMCGRVNTVCGRHFTYVS